MLNLLIVLLGKTASAIVRALNLGHGSTWPGHIALKLNKNFIHEMLRDAGTEIIIVAGTNGKTTTTKMIRTILEADGKKVIQNHSGANLLNGVASTLILGATASGKLDKDYALFEIDENTLPLILKNLNPDYILLLNLFRDQLDRYGEVHSIADRWREAIRRLPESTTLILNADDPEIAFMGEDTKAKKVFFGLGNADETRSEHDHAVDSVYCPRCGAKLRYKKLFFSHLGRWSCEKCKFTQPDLTISEYSTYPLFGSYNKYNTLAAVLLARTMKIEDPTIENALKNFSPAFGRQETILLKDKKIQIFLAKNPTGYNESLRTVRALHAKTILMVLNDRIADGRDISWIWDIDVESVIEDFDNIIVSGDRAYDMALRIKYAFGIWQMANGKWQIEENLDKAIQLALTATSQAETLYILPTYTAMLETRKILTGKKIL